MDISLKTKNDLEYLRISGRILSNVLSSLKSDAKEGTPLSFLDAKASALIKERGATPAFLGYKSDTARIPYPASICTSINDEIVHGLPRDYELKKGDVLSIDLGVDYKGYITDSASTIAIGKVPRKVFDLFRAVEGALDYAISVCMEGNTLGDIGYLIERKIKGSGFFVIQGLTGHGTGFKLHEDPTIYNFGEKGKGLKLIEGMVLAIEPMASIGTEFTKERADGTFVTKDGSIAAHFEHTVFIKKNGCEILTK